METGLHQNWHRDYDPSIGRYLQSDPIGLVGGLSTHGYAGSNPTGFVDPNGLQFTSVDATCARDPDFCAELFGQMVENSGALSGDECLAAQAQEVAGDIRTAGAVATVALVARMVSPGAANETVEQGGLNLYKSKSPSSKASDGWKEGDHFLYLPNRGSAKANWAQNASVLRAEMRKGRPIFDSYRNTNGKLISPTTGFLNAERNLLENHGWKYNPSMGAWLPPGGA